MCPLIRCSTSSTLAAITGSSRNDSPARTVSDSTDRRRSEFGSAAPSTISFLTFNHSIDNQSRTSGRSSSSIFARSIFAPCSGSVRSRRQNRAAGVEGVPQFVRVVDRHVREKRLQGGEPFREDSVVDPFRHPFGLTPRRACGGRPPILVEESHRAAQPNSQHRLVLTRLADRVQQPARTAARHPLAQSLVGEGRRPRYATRHRAAPPPALADGRSSSADDRSA